MTQTTATAMAPQPAQPAQPRKKSGGNKLNMVIAKTHQLSSRMVGMQLTGGNFIGIALSAIQMSLGFVFLTEPMTKGRWYMIAPIVVIGIALAVLIERLSIGGLSSVRESKREKLKLEDKFDRKYETKEPTERQQDRHDKKIKAYDRDIRAGWAFGMGGMTLSTVIGDIFWHNIFEPLGAWYLVIPMSLACACVIGLTFIHSELFKGLLDRVLVGILRDLNLMKAAIATEEVNMQLDVLAASMNTVRNDAEVRRPIEEKIGKVVVKRLSGFADNFSEIINIPDDTTIIEAEVLELPARAQSRGEYGQYKGELARIMAANPSMSVGQLAKHFGKPKSTVQGWVDKHKAGL